MKIVPKSNYPAYMDVSRGWLLFFIGVIEPLSLRGTYKTAFQYP